MALHINLYNEIQKAELARRRDPLKLASFAGIAFAVLLAFYYLYRWNAVSGVDSEAKRLLAEWSKVEPRQKQAIAQEQDLRNQQKANQLLVERVQNRFYWGPIFEELASVVPRNVQITSLVGDADLQKPPVTLLLAGVAAGQEPRTVAEQFRLALQQKLAATRKEVLVSFDANSLEDSPNTISLDGKSLATATFKIRVQLRSKPVAEVPPEPRVSTRRK